MSDLMTREEAIKELELIAKVTMWNDRREAVEMAIEALKDRPEEVHENLWVCPQCGFVTEHNVCPNCGTKLQGGDTE